LWSEMHILVTADTVGGVWSYTRELVTGLSQRGIQVTLVSFGGKPQAERSAWLDQLPDVAYIPTDLCLEWMQDAQPELEHSARYLLSVIRERKPDLLHLSQFCYGALDVGLPKLVVAHSDVMSWSRTVHGAEPHGSWAEWYREVVRRGLEGADLLVAPSHWMLECMESCYGEQKRSRVIYNGRTPALFHPHENKLNYAASAGRLWDEGKQSQLLMDLKQPPLPILLAGATRLGEVAENAGVVSSKPIDTGGGVAISEMPETLELPEIEGTAGTPGIRCVGELSEGGMRELLSRASIYIATSKYEPFGLAPLEAALSHCAIVANDIESLREVWGDAALYFRSRRSESLGEALRLLAANRQLCDVYADRAYEHARQHYTADRMVGEYVQAYTTLLERQAEAA
jgi:glycosyltransferase involved in cell wall biosynthesis